ncbi:Hypothetical protein PHPALM_428 [Phytophthora palmivora]|uniref:Uncharacterized protein n=1 Tax=Phytophthora palmivora TaxID=4796 RepID=A0A2P4YUW1_9STRA|nr:Hypothetical protein PHPALM_428 [Phytophthora palmivora]
MEYSDNSCATNVTSVVTKHCVTHDPATTCTPSAIVQSITASHETPATDQEAEATDQGTAVLSELNCWYIYDQNYGRQRLTVKSDYVSTKQTWNVARIIQRKPCRSGFMYRVLWCRKKSVGGRYYQRTWEPRRVLLEDGFTKELDLVDRWKNAETGRFDVFCRDDEFGGTSWKVICVFLKRLGDAGRDFLYKAMVKVNFSIPGRREARVLEEIVLEDGLYLVAAYNHEFVGHAFVLSVQGPNRLVFDLEKGEPVPSGEDWINFISFVRLFIIFEKE